MRAARLALVAQHRALFLSVWRRHAHVCENYSPARATARDGDDCTGMNFYHWGALTGFVSLLEAEGGGPKVGNESGLVLSESGPHTTAHHNVTPFRFSSVAWS